MAAQPTSVGDSAAYERRAVSSDDVVIVSACRTALCKAKRGGFKVRGQQGPTVLLLCRLRCYLSRQPPSPCASTREHATHITRLARLQDTPVDDLVAAVLAETLRRSGVEPEVRPALWGASGSGVCSAERRCSAAGSQSAALLQGVCC